MGNGKRGIGEAKEGGEGREEGREGKGKEEGKGGEGEFASLALGRIDAPAAYHIYKLVLSHPTRCRHHTFEERSRVAQVEATDNRLGRLIFSEASFFSCQ